MGNSNSSSAKKEFDNFYDIIDYIATYYILTMDFKSLSKLSEKEYCDKLVVLTSDIITKNFNDMEITYLAQRIKNGQEVNELSKEKVQFFNKDQLDDFDISNDYNKTIKKKRVCIGIAKFYVKIAHIFAAIMTTINPVYSYKDVNGEMVKVGLLEKDKIPKGTERKLYKLNVCDNRIRALKQYEEEADSDSVILQPKICDFNVDKNGQVKTLENEPGIPELMRLYLDDNYDYSNGDFTGMSESTKRQFMQDLKTFYTAFTGNDKMPLEITKFSDIKLRDYNLSKNCQGENALFKTKNKMNKKNKLFIAYADNIKNMIQSAADNQQKLLSVINELFTYVIDPYSGKKKIRVNPKLTEVSLQKTVEKTRKLIIQLYVKCEMDYTNGMKIYEAIVESKIFETTQKQIDSLKSQANKMIDETKKIMEPERTTLEPRTSLSNEEPNLKGTTLELRNPFDPSLSKNINEEPNLKGTTFPFDPSLSKNINEEPNYIKNPNPREPFNKEVSLNSSILQELKDSDSDEDDMMFNKPQIIKQSERQNILQTQQQLKPQSLPYNNNININFNNKPQSSILREPNNMEEIPNNNMIPEPIPNNMEEIQESIPNNIQPIPTNNIQPIPTNNMQPMPTNNMQPMPNNNIQPIPTNNMQNIFNTPQKQINNIQPMQKQLQFN
jgi:hypothetical protein